MDRDTRRLTGIERRLVADDPQLGEAFVLWHQRCSETAPPDGDDPTDPPPPDDDGPDPRRATHPWGWWA